MATSARAWSQDIHFPEKEPVAGTPPPPIALAAVREFRFPKPVPDCSFPKLPLRDGETGKIMLNERLLAAARIVHLSVHV